MFYNRRRVRRIWIHLILSSHLKDMVPTHTFIYEKKSRNQNTLLFTEEGFYFLPFKLFRLFFLVRITFVIKSSSF